MNRTASWRCRSTSSSASFRALFRDSGTRLPRTNTSQLVPATLPIKNQRLRSIDHISSNDGSFSTWIFVAQTITLLNEQQASEGSRLSTAETTDPCEFSIHRILQYCFHRSMLRPMLFLWLASLAVATKYAGLQNLGNTCYLNAQLQCAYHIPHVRKLILESGQDDGATATTVDSDESSLSSGDSDKQRDDDDLS